MINLKVKFLDKFNADDELAINRKNIAASNYTSGVINNLIGGNFFTGFLLLMNADDNFMGIVSMTGLIGNLLQIFSPLLLERFQKRKGLLIFCRALIYFFNIIVISAVQFFPSTDRIKLMLILSVTLLVNFINAVSAPGFSVWHIRSIPEKVRAGYYSFFNITNGIILYTVILASSKAIDCFKASGKEMEGLMVFRAIAFILCFADIFFLFKIKEYPNERSEANVNLVNILRNPLRQKRYLITIFIACLWSYSSNIPGPYFNVYMLKDLGVSYTFLNLISMFNIPALILLTPLWRKMINSTSWFRTFYFSIGLFSLNYIGLSFVSKNTLALYPISILFSFLVSPGIYLVLSNMPYVNIPDKDQTNYIGFYSAMYNLSAFLGVFTGKEFIKFTDGKMLSLFGFVMQNKQYMLLVTAAVMAVSVILIYMLQKKSDSK